MFAGGDSHRDHELVLATAHAMPQVRFLLATTALPEDVVLPANVELHRVRVAQYPALMARSHVVLVALVPGLTRSVGLLTLLSAMWLRRPTVITRSPTAADYVDDGVTGFVVAADLAVVQDRLVFVLDPANADLVAQVATRARAFVVNECSYERYVRQIVDAVEECRTLRLR